VQGPLLLQSLTPPSFVSHVGFHGNWSPLRKDLSLIDVQGGVRICGSRGGHGLLEPLRLVEERDREFFIDNLLVQIHLIIEKVLVDRAYAMGV